MLITKYMNSSLYKLLIKKHFCLLFFFSLVIGFSRCVPIEDLVQPIIGEFELQNQYNVSDTIRLRAVLTDNFGINTVRIDINPVGDVARPWNYTKSRDSVRARLLNIEELQVIPSNISLGQYELTLTITDISGLERTTSRRFIVEGDIIRPVFTDVILPQLELIGNNSYRGCRSDLIEIAGTVRDNVGLREVRAQFGNFPPIVRALTGQASVDLSSVFGNALIIPANVINGTSIPLQLQATDTEGNVSNIASLDILVECDDAIPTVDVLVTNPATNADGLIEVIQGEELFIVDGQITDNEQLDSIFIYFVDGSTETIILEESINGNSTINIRSLFGNIAVPIPSNAAVGSSYQIVVLVKDTAGNESVAYIANILITRNAPPQILVANTYVNNIERNFSLTSPNQIPAGAVIRVEGKVEEDVALEYYRITWGVEGSEETIVNFNSTILQNNIPFNIANPISENEFLTNENVRAGTRYVLTFFVKDTLNAEVRLRYIFVIQ